MTLADIRFWLFTSLVFAMPLSLYPSFSLPLFNFPTFRIGLYQVLAVLFVLTATPLLLRSLRHAYKHPLVMGAGIFLLLAFLWGSLTTTNLPRTLLYSGSLVSLIVLAVAAFATYRELNNKRRALIPVVLLWSGLIFGVLTLIELLFITLGWLPASVLCTGCVSSVFGFPRVNLFAAEPQFLANSLLPALVAAMFFKDAQRIWFAPATLLVTSAAIAITFSRGAYVAIVVAICAYVLILIVNKSFTKLRVAFQNTVTVAVGTLVGFVLLISSASYLYRDSPYITYNTTVSALSHVSLGLITLPEHHPDTPVAVPNPATPHSTSPTAHFDPKGYIAASSNERLSAAETALSAWNDSPLTMLFGVGMGNLGGYVRTHAVPNAPADLTVYIFYVLLLSELGLVGLAVLLLTIGTILYRTWRHTESRWLMFAFMLTIAFAVQLTFFGSYINVMYLYMWLGIFLALPEVSKRRIIKGTDAKQ